MKSEMTSSLSLEGLTVKCSNCAKDVDIARMGDHLCQSGAPFQATGEATPPPDHEIEFQSRSSFNEPLPSPGRRQEHDYLPWSSQQQGNSFDPSGKPTRLGPLPRIDPFAANKPFLRPDVLTPNSAKSIPHTPTSATISKQPPASPLHPQPRPYMAASQSSFIPYSITAAASSPGPEQQRHPLASSDTQNEELPAPPSMSYDIQNPNGPMSMRSPGFPTDMIPPLSPHPGLNRLPSNEDAKHRRETSIDSKSVHSRNPYHSGSFSGLSIRDTSQKGELATVPASPAVLNEYSPANIVSDAEQPQMATGRSRGYSSKYGPPSPTSHYAASHAPSESIYSTQFRLDEEFSVANFARDIGLMDASDEMYIDDEELDMTIGDLEAHQSVVYAEPTRMHHSTNSESTQGSRASGFNAASVSTSATSVGRSDSQDFKEATATVKGGPCHDGLDSPTDPFFMHGRLSHPNYNGRHKSDSVAKQIPEQAPSVPKLQDAPAQPRHRTQKSSVSSVASKIKAGRRCSAGHCDKGSPIITQFPLPPGAPSDGMSGGRRPSKAESISFLRGNGPIGFPVDASSELEQGIKRLRGFNFESTATIPHNGGLPTPSSSVEKLSACHEVSETQEAGSGPQPKTKVEQEMKQEDQNEPRSEPSEVKTEVVAPPAPSPAPISPKSPSKPRVRNRTVASQVFQM
ncbi:Sm-like protein lsm7 [Ascosphaera pollenicola]|nr:Sm-like protein lsm7 [Ascosphaera pollenicola]